MSDITTILARIDSGDAHAAVEILPLVYDQLRRLAAIRMAKEKPGQTLDATSLVHEAYLRVVKGNPKPTWDSQRHFFTAASEAMRRILIDRARWKKRPKHGGNHEHVDIDINCPANEETPERLLAINEALSRLEFNHPETAALLKLRFFVGMPAKDAADQLGISPATAKRRWAFARAFLYKEIGNA